MNAAAFILAGGKSSRMGADKAFLRLDGKTLLELASDHAHAVCDSVRVIGSREKFGADAIEDVFSARGPLAGIHAALRSPAAAELNLVLAVDLPFVQPGFLRYLLQEADASSASVVVPHGTTGWQPLCAVYRQRFADAAEHALRAGHNKIDALFSQLQLRIVEEEEINKAGFSPGMFDNVNSREDFARASKNLGHRHQSR